ncbi:crossover junction endodeoxyribonuclease RuvC [Actinobacteria bacterium YIM 96077]|uniref:Crossover junction endodeoxyribonuclease RuvC n=1 Tax=Phytoactinopolyspora halophila TaxID=1981511 RepID=A0A329QFX5_9ACTN|nr:crossover junction endodeoxyribonuclease RuvC [Phytoactinopolyspora halophila]AYY13468.1 crossover junction endodeoxyribonuclease RuvC [Actinobacteria bacterium YIM 96077]RAW10861.1 crossover junction endodeoxyribonuclease RuvC [Phytoactinopolyspora halophila]
MRVLGIDPGLTRCGLGVVDGLPGRKLRLIDVSVVRSGSDVPLGQRLLLIEEKVDAWIAEYAPEAVAIERVFSQHNVRTVMGTAQASGVAALVAARRGLSVAAHTPSEVKAAVSGNGQADKAQVASMVMRLLQLEAKPTPADAADALALAICHAWRGSADGMLRRAGGSAPANRLRAAARDSGSQWPEWPRSATNGESP